MLIMNSHRRPDVCGTYRLTTANTWSRFCQLRISLERRSEWLHTLAELHIRRFASFDLVSGTSSSTIPRHIDTSATTEGHFHERRLVRSLCEARLRRRIPSMAAMAATSPSVPPERPGVPSRNPLPLSASQEAQVRDIFYARVRSSCQPEIKGK